MSNNEYRVDGLSFRQKLTEAESNVVTQNLNAAVTDLTNRLTDPTVCGVTLTAVIKGQDDTIEVAELSLKRNDEPTEDDRLYYGLSSWHHRVPDSVHDVYDNLASSLSVYNHSQTESDTDFEVASIAIGDPNSEVVLTTQVEDVASSFFNNTDDEEEACEEDEC